MAEFNGASEIGRRLGQFFTGGGPSVGSELARQEGFLEASRGEQALQSAIANRELARERRLTSDSRAGLGAIFAQNPGVFGGSDAGLNRQLAAVAPAVLNAGGGNIQQVLAGFAAAQEGGRRLDLSNAALGGIVDQNQVSRAIQPFLSSLPALAQVDANGVGFNPTQTLDAQRPVIVDSPLNDSRILLNNARAKKASEQASLLKSPNVFSVALPNGRNQLIVDSGQRDAQGNRIGADAITGAPAFIPANAIALNRDAASRQANQQQISNSVEDSVSDILQLGPEAEPLAAIDAVEATSGAFDVLGGRLGETLKGLSGSVDSPSRFTQARSFLDNINKDAKRIVSVNTGRIGIQEQQDTLKSLLVPGVLSGPRAAENARNLRAGLFTLMTDAIEELKQPIDPAESRKLSDVVTKSAELIRRLDARKGGRQSVSAVPGIAVETDEQGNRIFSRGR